MHSRAASLIGPVRALSTGERAFKANRIKGKDLWRRFNEGSRANSSSVFLFCSEASTTLCACANPPHCNAHRAALLMHPRKSRRARRRASAPSAGRVGAPSRTRRAVMKRKRALPSTTAGRASRNCRRSRPRVGSTRRARSSPATTRRTSRSTARSIPIAAASTAASTASRGRPTPIWACRRGSISNRSCSSSPTRRSCSSASCRRRATRRARSRSAPTPIRTSRSSASYEIMRGILEVLERAGHPVGIVTKSALVVRDLDILAPHGASAISSRSRSR